MFDHLVESQANTEDLKRKGGFLGLFTLGYVLLLSIVLIGSIVWYDAHLDSQNLELETLVAPVPIPEVKVEQKQEEKPKQQDDNVDTRKQIMLDTSENTKPPEKISTEKNEVKVVRKGVQVKLGSEDSDAANPNPSGGAPGTGMVGGNTPTPATMADDDKDLPPQTKPSPKPPPKTISGGVLNGKAISLPKPQYPQIARAAKASGTVVVQVTIDESGKVVSASAVSGHPLLKAAAVQAAYGARFSPTMLSGQAVKVTGQINYNFLPQ